MRSSTRRSSGGSFFGLASVVKPGMLSDPNAHRRTHLPVTLDATDRQQLLDRFLRYVKVDTRSDEASETSPTTEKQKDLSLMLVDELKELGCDDAVMPGLSGRVELARAGARLVVEDSSGSSFVPPGEAGLWPAVWSTLRSGVAR